MESAQGLLQTLDNFLILDGCRLPVARFIEQTKMIGVGEAFFFGFHFHPPTPEFTLFWRGLHIDAYSQAVEKKAILFTLLFTDVRAQSHELLNQSAFRVSTR
ncbi:hypothetical protein D3C78_928580 [compost metagenome]